MHSPAPCGRAIAFDDRAGQQEGFCTRRRGDAEGTESTSGSHRSEVKWTDCIELTKTPRLRVSACQNRPRHVRVSECDCPAHKGRRNGSSWSGHGNLFAEEVDEPRHCRGLGDRIKILSLSFQGTSPRRPPGMRSGIRWRGRGPGRKCDRPVLGCRSRGCGFGTTHGLRDAAAGTSVPAADLRIASPTRAWHRASAPKRGQAGPPQFCLWGAAGAAGCLPGASGPGTAAGAG